MEKKGFTIIEVVLVLAIGGLIFLMVFIALPALQRSQRNTQRREDVDRIQTALIEYQSNNKGRLPFTDEKYDTNFVSRYVDSECKFDKKLSRKYKDYFTYSQFGGYAYNDCSDAFMDPDGTAYAISFAEGAAGGHNINPWYQDMHYEDETHVIKVATNSACGTTENSLEYKEGDNYFIVAYKLEGGQLYCVDNS